MNEMNHEFDMTTSAVLDSWLEPVVTPDVARRLVAIEADERVTARVLDLGRKASEGRLTAAEVQEYDAYIAANDILAILQAKARQVLRQHGS
jgi:hypothetical protein